MILHASHVYYRTQGGQIPASGWLSPATDTDTGADIWHRDHIEYFDLPGTISLRLL